MTVVVGAGDPPTSTAPTSTAPVGQRLDRALVERGLIASRTRAAAAIRDGRVRVAGRPAQRPSQPVGTGDEVVLVDGPQWASRGADKLVGALDALGGPPVAGRRCLDVGASTGGFTDVLLRAGASHVVAVDVGHDQLVPGLAADPRVEVIDGVNARDLDPARIGGPAELTVCDLSFISLRHVLASLTRCTAADLVPMVKPQFEVGRDRLGRGGVVRDDRLRVDAVWDVCRHAADLGWGLVGAAESTLAGPAGNREVFVWLRRDAAPPDRAVIERALRERAHREPAGRP